MSDVLAGIGQGNCGYGQRVTQRRRFFEPYVEAMADFQQMQWMSELKACRSIRWSTCFTSRGPDAEARSRQVTKALKRHLIEVRPVWKPMHLPPLFDGAPYFPHEPVVDISANLFRTGICLPSGSNLDSALQDRVIDHLRHVLLIMEGRDALA